MDNIIQHQHAYTTTVTIHVQYITTVTIHVQYIKLFRSKHMSEFRCFIMSISTTPYQLFKK